MIEFKNRREKIVHQLIDQSIAVVFSGAAVRKSADGDYPFSVNRNFYYLTGIDEPEAILVLIKSKTQNKEILYIRDIDTHLEKWNGKYLATEQAKQISQIENVEFLSKFESKIASLLLRSNIDCVYTDNDRYKQSDRPLEGEQFIKSIQFQYPSVISCNLFPIIAQARTIKSELEIKDIEKAIEITRVGFERMLLAPKTGQFEYQLQAEFNYALQCQNASPAFEMIVASSTDACILHYTKNQKMIAEDVLILCDMGASKNYYNADISRTFSSSNKFTERQKQLMNIVLEAMEAVFDHIKPQVPLSKLNEVVIDVYEKRLKELKMIEQRTDVMKYYYHGVSHFLGLDVHDVGQMENQVLQVGQVITVEPGLYIEEENLGIRIEDNILVTAEGYRNLSSSIIKSPEDIENYISKHSKEQG